MKRIIKAVTLMELLIALVLLAIIVLGIGQIDIFSNLHVLGTERRAKIDNEISLALTHMTKGISKAIGNEVSGGANSVVNIANVGDYTAIRAYVDTADDYVSAGDGQTGTQGDHWIAYEFTGTVASDPANRYQIWYCPRCTDSSCVTCNTAWGTAGNTIARNISAVTITKPVDSSSQLNNNYVTIEITGCWDPATVDVTINHNGTRLNPCVDMNSRINMPSVSVN
ncbi:MAG: hypothetical protein WC723_03170 [Candidatus Omnitrophota bacterium]